MLLVGCEENPNEKVKREYNNCIEDVVAEVMNFQEKRGVDAMRDGNGTMTLVHIKSRRCEIQAEYSCSIIHQGAGCQFE
jgi:hypothetical protein